MLCTLHTEGEGIPPATLVLSSPAWGPAVRFPVCAPCAAGAQVSEDARPLVIRPIGAPIMRAVEALRAIQEQADNGPSD